MLEEVKIDWTDAIAALRKELYHIHSMGSLLYEHYYHAVDAQMIKVDLTEPSTPIISISDMVSAKAEACLEILEDLEEKTSRACQGCYNKIVEGPTGQA